MCAIDYARLLRDNLTALAGKREGIKEVSGDINNNMKYITTASIAFLVLFPFIASAQTYTRTPTGTTPTSPIAITVSAMDQTPLWQYFGGYWKIGFMQTSSNNNPVYYSTCEPTSITGGTFIISGAGGTEIDAVKIIGYHGSSCANADIDGGSLLEGDNSTMIFTINNPPVVPDPLGVRLASSTMTTAYGFNVMGGTLGFLSGIFILVLATGLGLLRSLLPFILGLGIIAGIVYFAYRALGHFRH